MFLYSIRQSDFSHSFFPKRRKTERESERETVRDEESEKREEKE